MKEKLNNLLSLLNNELGLFLIISCSVAFFVLIFKPFPLDHINFDNSILFVFGFGAIVFFVLLIVRIIYPVLVYKMREKPKRVALSFYNRCLTLWLLSSVLVSLYLIYLGLVSLNMFLVFKVLLICTIPPLILMFHDKNVALQLENELLSLEKKVCQEHVQKYKDEHKNISIEFISTNTNEKISLSISDVVFINSADNYVEIHYKKDDNFNKKLLRNTLKNIELQLNPYHIFLRCHRKYIINSHYIDKLNGNCNHHELLLKGYKKPIPVSRQYFYRIKDTL